MDTCTTREEARLSLLHHAGTKIQTLKNRIEEARQGYQLFEKYIQRQQHVLVKAEAAKLYFQLTLTDEALALGHVVVRVRPQGSTADDENLLLLSGMSILSISFDLCSHSCLQRFPDALARWALKRRRRAPVPPPPHSYPWLIGARSSQRPRPQHPRLIMQTSPQPQLLNMTILLPQLLPHPKICRLLPSFSSLLSTQSQNAWRIWRIRVAVDRLGRSLLYLYRSISKSYYSAFFHYVTYASSRWSHLLLHTIPRV